MGLICIDYPEPDPVTVDEAKDQVLQGSIVDDGYLGKIVIPAARDAAELATGRALMGPQTWDYVLDRFPCDDFIELPKPPLRSVTYLKYRDTTGTLQTWASSNYILLHDTTTLPVLNPRQPRGRLALAYGVVWPSTYGQRGDITIRFVAGYGDRPEDMPALLKAGLLLDIASRYVHRDDEVPAVAKSIYWSCRSHPTQRLAA